MTQDSMKNGDGVILFEAPDGQVRVDVRLGREMVWLTQDQMSQLFGRERSVITKQIRNVFRESELEPEATSAKFARVQILGNMQKMHIAFAPPRGAAYLKIKRQRMTKIWNAMDQRRESCLSAKP